MFYYKESCSLFLTHPVIPVLGLCKWSANLLTGLRRVCFIVSCMEQSGLFIYVFVEVHCTEVCGVKRVDLYSETFRPHWHTAVTCPAQRS